MRLIYFLLICSLPSTLVVAQDYFAWTAKPGEGLLRLDLAGNIATLLTTQRILQLENNTWQEKWVSTEPLTAAARIGNGYWVGSKKGLHSINATTWQLETPTDIRDIAAIEATSTAGAIVSSYQAGVFETEGAALRKIVASYNVNTVCDCGGWRWLGTNAGLMRMKDGEVVTYSEEGVKGFEIPDNVVDALFCPNGNRLVVIMPEAIDFFDLTEQESASHGNHFDFIGERGNTVTDVLPMPNGTLLLLTEKGLLYLEKQVSDNHHHEASGFKEVFSTSATAQVLPLNIGEGNWQKGFIDRKGNTWLASTSKVVKIRTKKLIKLAAGQRNNG